MFTVGNKITCGADTAYMIESIKLSVEAAWGIVLCGNGKEISLKIAKHYTESKPITVNTDTKKTIVEQFLEDCKDEQGYLPLRIKDWLAKKTGNEVVTLLKEIENLLAMKKTVKEYIQQVSLLEKE